MVVALSGDKGRQVFFESKDLGFGEGCKFPVRTTCEARTDFVHHIQILSYSAKRPNQTKQPKKSPTKTRTNLSTRSKASRSSPPIAWRRNLPVLISDTKEALEAIKNDASGRTNPFESLYRIVFRLTIRMVGPTEIAEDPDKLEAALKMFEMIDRSATATSVIFPKLPSPAIIQRTYAGTRLYMMIDSIIKKRAASDEKHEDALQQMLDQGDRAVRIVEFIVPLPQPAWFEGGT